jgi:plastocyanin
MSKRLIYIVGGGVGLAVIALIAARWYLVRQAEATKVMADVVSTTLTKPKELPVFQIDYTDQGFSPAEATIQLGTLVSFKNSSAIPMWTASDPHPTHTDYPEFDAKKDYAPGETFSFYFTKLGTFGYHNHEKSLHRGIIHVVDAANPLPSIDKTKQSQRARRDKFMAILKPGDPTSVYKLMDAINKNQGVAKDCHDMSQDWGHYAYELYGFSGAMTYNDPSRNGLRDMDHVCAGGYMHGILEELFLNQPELKDNPNSICVNVPAINRGSCFHGVGHGLMFVTERNIQSSLAICKSLPDVIDERRCYEGVFMEMYWGDTDHAGANSLGWTPETPLEPCKETTDDAKPDCFLYAHLGYLREHSRDFTGALHLCTQSGLGIWDERYCLRGVGITMMKHVTSHHLEETESLVAGLGDGEKNAYYEGVIGYARLSSVSEDDLAVFCSLLKDDAEVCAEVQKNYPK